MEIFLSIFGLPFIITGIIYYQKGNKLFQDGKRVKAEVVDLVKKAGQSYDDFNRSYYYHPVISFQTLEGDSVRKELNIGSNPSYYSVGQQVTAVYDPKDPDNCGIHSKFQLLGVPATFIAVGLIVMAIATAFYLEVF